MFKVAPGPRLAWLVGRGRHVEGDWPGQAAAANKLDVSHFPPLLPSPQPSLPLSQPGPAPNSDFTTQFSAAFPSKELVVNVRMSGKTGT